MKSLRLFYLSDCLEYFGSTNWLDMVYFTSVMIFFASACTLLFDIYFIFIWKNINTVIRID